MFKRRLKQPIGADELTRLKTEINETIQKCTKNHSSMNSASGLVESYRVLRSTEEIKKSLLNVLKLIENMPTGDMPDLSNGKQDE